MKLNEIIEKDSEQILELINKVNEQAALISSLQNALGSAIERIEILEINASSSDDLRYNVP